MTDPRDDDALSWGGDDDPTLDTGAPRRPAAGDATSASLPDGFTAVGKGSEAVVSGDVPPRDARAVDAADADAADADAPATGEPGAPAPLGNVALVALGLLGGMYLLFTIGWFIGGSRLQAVAPLLLVSPAAYVPAFWLAVLAPAIWFVATLVLTRRSATWVRFVWLVAGAVLLVPWPFVMIGVVGQ